MRGALVKYAPKNCSLLFVQLNALCKLFLITCSYVKFVQMPTNKWHTTYLHLTSSLPSTSLLLIIINLRDTMQPCFCAGQLHCGEVYGQWALNASGNIYMVKNATLYQLVCTVFVQVCVNAYTDVQMAKI